MNSSPATLNIDEWVVAVREPETIENAPVVVLLHGWTGDENSMWVFGGSIPDRALVIAPRGLFESKHPDFSGFSWVANQTEKWAAIEDFDHSVNQLHGLLERFSLKYPTEFSKFSLVGFSQGAALSAAYLLRYPHQVARLAMLSGFLPVGAASKKAELSTTKVFIGHGSLDEIVPEEKAQQAHAFFQQSGAEVQYCLSEVGHKLGSHCFKSFTRFMADI